MLVSVVLRSDLNELVRPWVLGSLVLAIVPSFLAHDDLNIADLHRCALTAVTRISLAVVACALMVHHRAVLRKTALNFAGLDPPLLLDAVRALRLAREVLVGLAFVHAAHVLLNKVIGCEVTFLTRKRPRHI